MARSNYFCPEFGPTEPATTEAGTVRQWPWPTLLVAASAIGSLAFACVTPFAALAAVTGRTLSRRAALLTVGVIWLANQALGYGVLAYPWSIESVSWGFAIGAAALAGTGAAFAAGWLTSGQNAIVAVAAALAAAFGGYELCLYLVSFGLGGEEAFAPAIVARLALLNVIWTVVLIAVYEGCRLVIAVGWIPASFGMQRAVRQ